MNEKAADRRSPTDRADGLTHKPFENLAEKAADQSGKTVMKGMETSKLLLPQSKEPDEVGARVCR